MTNSIKQIHAADWVQMGETPIRQPLPNKTINNIGPLLLIHHHQSNIPSNSNPANLGVGPHPHTGFAPVTFILKGNVNHRDSHGNNSIVEEGGVQWMNAGKGIIHSERPSKQLAVTGGEQEIIQVWINSPAQFKQQPAQYFALHKNNIPTIVEEGLLIKIIAGNYQNINGFNNNQSPLTILEIHSSAATQYTFKLTSGWEHALYNLDENITIDNKTINGSQLVVLNNEIEEVTIHFNKPTRLLLFSMQAFNEPIATYGPFVMNNQTEIMQAMRNYQMGKMGILIEEF